MLTDSFGLPIGDAGYAGLTLRIVLVLLFLFIASFTGPLVTLDGWKKKDRSSSVSAFVSGRWRDFRRTAVGNRISIGNQKIGNIINIQYQCVWSIAYRFCLQLSSKDDNDHVIDTMVVLVKNESWIMNPRRPYSGYSQWIRLGRNGGWTTRVMRNTATLLLLWGGWYGTFSLTDVICDGSSSHKYCTVHHAWSVCCAQVQYSTIIAPQKKAEGGARGAL